MRAQDIVIGTHYRFHHNPRFGYAKAIKVLKAKQEENTNTYGVVKCYHKVSEVDSDNYIKYFRPCDLEKQKNKG